MALVKWQYPGDLADNEQWAHQSSYPQWYTAVSDAYGAYDDFKYKFSIYTVDGILASPFKSVPLQYEGVGKFNPSNILKQQFYPEFNSEIRRWTPKGGSILNYYVKCQEYAKELAAPDSTEFDKHICVRNWKEDFNYEDYLMKGATTNFPSYWLNNLNANREVQLTDYSTLRCISGQIKEGSSIYISYAYELNVVVTDTDGNSISYLLANPNPYWSTTNSDQPTGNTLSDVTNYMLEVPTGAANLNGLKFKYKVAGVWNYTSADIITSSTDYYDIITYQWPKGDNGKTSAAARYKIMSYCNYTPIRIFWENELSGFDDFNFELVSTKNIEVKHSTYKKQRDTQGGKSGIKLGNNKYIGNSDASRGEDIYHTNIDEYYVANTEYLTDEQVLDLESLWSSQNVFANISGTIYPIISMIKKRKINTTQNDVRNYNIEFRLSNKKIIN